MKNWSKVPGTTGFQENDSISSVEFVALSIRSHLFRVRNDRDGPDAYEFTPGENWRP
ncbi:hypothetical protein QEZ54_27490 [Catellatospora sp. KI3]|uniref:hypothetical protein n=1 Tax=Catellatospora sp. KI3 TaxID=3041620 RepID=UPI002482AFC9|nr:hypothetical protein [Catellatospora sp. KI3]MDI1464720.1 hypothetical protein [Catellatospora sp. KI3]